MRQLQSKKLEEAGPLREEIIEQIKLQQPLHRALLSTGLLIVGLALQPSISGLTDCPCSVSRSR